MQQKLIWILWPAFIIAGAAEAVFFTVFDPRELSFFGEPLALGRVAAYSIGFFLFWALAGASSALTCFFQRTAAEINRCPFPVSERPAGCPKGPNGNASCC
jgi:hypothetical protein